MKVTFIQQKALQSQPQGFYISIQKTSTSLKSFQIGEK
jgi:hypothetical protein